MNPSSSHSSIVVIKGDGIGPEVVDATLAILTAAKVPFSWTICEAGEALFKQGIQSGASPETLATIQSNGVVLKGPLGTPVGHGERSANVFLRKSFGLFANIRPVKQYPNIPSVYQDVPIDMVVIRENIEDLYAGIEYEHQPGIAQSIKLISRMGCDYINRFAFEYVKQTGRSSLHCATKANILKATEGMMKRSFEDMAPDYEGITAKHIIIDNCAHQLVMNPSQFDAIVTTNMNGDIISDLTSGLVGGLGIAPSANIGPDVAMFEAVHGTAPSMVGEHRSNPTAMLLSAVMMLRHMTLDPIADTIENALIVTLEQKKLTRDLNKVNGLSTTEFTQAIIENLGKQSDQFTPSRFPRIVMPPIAPDPIVPSTSHGVDIVIVCDDDYDALIHPLSAIGDSIGCTSVALFNRGQRVDPNHRTATISQWYVRFEWDPTNDLTPQIPTLIQRISDSYEWVHMDRLVSFKGH